MLATASTLSWAQAPVLKVGDTWKIQFRNTAVNPPTLQWSESRMAIAVDEKETSRVIEPNTGEKYVAVHDAATDRRLMSYRYDEAPPDRRGKLLGDWSKNDALVQFPLETGKR